MDSENKKKKFNTYWWIYIILVVFVLLSVFVLCIDYEGSAKQDFGIGLLLSIFLLFVAAIFISVILKLIFTSRVKFWIMLVSVFASVIISFNVTETGLSQNGILRPLIEYGGPLYFIRIGDYNFDGISDKGRFPSEESRRKAFTYNIPYSSESSVYMKEIDFRVGFQSKGDSWGTVSEDGRRNLIILEFDDDVYKLNYIEMDLSLHNNLVHSSSQFDVGIYISNEKGERLSRISGRNTSSTHFKFGLNSSELKSVDDKLYIYFEIDSVG